MRLRRLTIENFGIFSGAELEFAAGGLALVYGPNEAGKSTLLQLIRELLFGFAHQNPYALERRTGEMAAQALVETADGRLIRFRRRKGLRATVVGEIEATGERIDEDDLARILGGATEELYRHVFGFSLTELSSGEKSLRQAGLSEALFGGGVGGLANLRRVEETFLERQQALFKPAAKKPRINDLLIAIREKSKELREAAVKPRDYERLHAERRRLEAESDELAGGLESLRRRSRHLERLETALGSWRRLAVVREELACLSVPRDFPLDALEEFRRARSALDALEEELRELAEDLAEKRARLAELAPAPELIRAEAPIRVLHQRVGQVQRFRADIPLRLEEARNIRVEAGERLRELSPGWSLSELDQLQTGLAQREAVQRMADERSELRERELALEGGRPELKRRIRACERRLEELDRIDEPSELRALRAVVERSSRYRADCDRQGELETEIAPVEEAVSLLERQVAAPLGQPSTEGGTHDQSPADSSEFPESAATQRRVLESLPVPLEAAVREFQERLAGVASDARAARKSLDAARAELAERRSAFARLDAAAVPDRESLLRRRRDRDELWRAIRRRYLDGDAGAEAGVAREPAADTRPAADGGTIGDAGDENGDTRSLPERYEHEVLRADALADERQTKAELVAQAEQLSRLILEQKERVLAAEEVLSRENARQASVEKEWKDLWRSCELDPLAPAAMLEWLRLHGELREKSAQLRILRSRQETLEERIRTFSDELDEAVRAAGTGSGVSASGSPGGPEGDVDVRLAEARRRVEQAAEAVRERARVAAELPAEEERLAALDRELAGTAARIEEWQHRWRSLLDELGFPAAWDVDLALKILDGLAAVGQKVRDARSLEERVGAMETETAAFESGVDDVVGAVAPDLRNLPAEDAVLDLVERLDAAKRAETERGMLASEIEKAERRLDSRRERRRVLKKSVERLFERAGARSAEEFETVARAAGRRNELALALEALERELKTIRGPEEEKAFLEELAAADSEAIASELGRLREDIAAAEEARQEVLREVGIARKNVADLERGSAIDRISLELESLRSELSEACDEWASLVLGRALIARELERFERENQPAMLREVTRLFQVMTGGEYTGVARKLDDRGTILVAHRGGGTKEPSQLSRGTREQLYLAIRLAYVKRYCEDAEPLPIVMDDVLVNFDDARARYTLEVLAELSAKVQILYLTCHESRIALFREVLPAAEPVLLPGVGTSPREARTGKERPAWAGSGESWRTARDIFERDGAGPRGEREIPGRESSLRRRPGLLE